MTRPYGSLQKKQIYLLALLLLVALCGVPIAHADRPVDAGRPDDAGVSDVAVVSGYVIGEIVVKLKPGANSSIAEINTDYGTVTADTFLASRGIYLLKTEAQTRSIVGQMQNDPRLDYAELNYILDTPEANPLGEWAWGSDDLTVAAEADPLGEWAWGGTNDAPLNDDYATDLIQLDSAHATADGTGSIVAILDTGIQPDHPMLAGVLLPGYDFVDDDNDPTESLEGLDDDGDGLVDEAAGHGTHVAGIVHTVAPAAAILPVRVLDSDGRGNLFLIAEAIGYAVEQGANVINLSLGIAVDAGLLQDVVEQAIADGAVVVAAAGNLGVTDPQFPAGYDDVIAVTAVDENATRIDMANYGWWVDVAAPGKSIYSAFPIDGYAWWTGTSMATPFVAGSAALILDMQPNADPQSVADALFENTNSKRRDEASAENIPLLDLTRAFSP